MTKLDHSKGGRYERDPAREQPFDDFVERDEVIVKRKQKRPLSIWALAMKALRQKEVSGNNALTQAQLLTALGHSKKSMRRQYGAAILKRLVTEGLLLKNGKPNLDHPRVVQIMKERKRGGQK